MSHKKDYWEDWRRYIIPKLGSVAQLLEDITGDPYYVRGPTHNNQFVGRVDMSEEMFEKELHNMGFDRNPVSSLKTLVSTGEKEEASFRKIGFENHPKMQLHVVLYDGNKMDNSPSGSVYVYAHWEMRWDVAPLKHYRSKNFSGPKGARRMKNMLDAEGIVYTLERPPA